MLFFGLAQRRRRRERKELINDIHAAFAGGKFAKELIALLTDQE